MSHAARVLDRLATLASPGAIFALCCWSFLGLADPQQPAIKLDPKDEKNAAARLCKIAAAFSRSRADYGCHHRRFALDRRGKRRVRRGVGRCRCRHHHPSGRQFQAGICSAADAAIALSTNQHAPAVVRHKRPSLVQDHFGNDPSLALLSQEHHRASTRKSVLPGGTYQCTCGTWRL